MPKPTPKPRTPAQIAASRQNGAKGRGPRSAAGKAASAQNARKHGLTATTAALLPDEDEAAFASHCEAIEAEHAPQGPTERALVGQLALVLWRMRRVEALEVEVLTARERRVSENYVGGYHPFSPLLWDAGRLDTVLRYRAQLERSQTRLLKELGERKAVRAADDPPPAPPPIPVPALRNEPEPPARQALPVPAPANDDPAPSAQVQAQAQAQVQEGRQGTLRVR